jgi:hypothetical protein
MASFPFSPESNQFRLNMRIERNAHLRALGADAANSDRGGGL